MIAWHLATVALYLVGCVWGLGMLYRPGRPWAGMTRFWVLAGFLMQTGAGLWVWRQAGRFPITQVGDSLWLLVWFLALAFLLIDAVYRLPTLGPILLPLIVVLGGVSLFFPHGVRLESLPAWTPVHVVTNVLGFAAFALAAISSVAYLLQERRLKRKAPDLPARLPSLETLDRINFHALLFGFPLLTVGLTLGVTAAVTTGMLGRGWWSDSKVMLSLTVWGFFAVVVVGRVARLRSGRSVAWLTVVGFTLVVVTLLVADVVIPGVHSGLGR